MRSKLLRTALDACADERYSLNAMHGGSVGVGIWAARSIDGLASFTSGPHELASHALDGLPCRSKGRFRQ